MIGINSCQLKITINSFLLAFTIVPIHRGKEGIKNKKRTFNLAVFYLQVANDSKDMFCFCRAF